MTDKPKHVKLVIENPTTGEIKTLEFTLPRLTNDCPETNQHRQRVVVIRRRLSWKKLSKLPKKII